MSHINQLLDHLPGMRHAADAFQCSNNGNFLGLPHWYDHLCGKEFKIPDSIPLILLSVLEILLRIAGIAAIAYVVFGGVKYVVSQGEPDKVSEAKGTIINALAGMLIAALAIAIVSFIGARIG